VSNTTVTQKITYIAKHYSRAHKKWFDGIEKEELEGLMAWVKEMNQGRPGYYRIFEKIVTVETVETRIEVSNE
jgi:hypothetical protein